MIAAYSCVYPFSPDIDTTEGRLVIEGDIIIGGTSKVSLSYMAAIKEVEYTYPDAEVWVEGDDGSEYRPSFSSSDDSRLSFTIDLSKASSAPRYRLCVRNRDNGRDYASEWLDVLQSPQIDSVGYVIDETENKMQLRLSAHSDSGEKYFRWTYDEDWEYHSLHRATVYYEPPEGWNKGRNGNWGEILEFEEGENIYYCWGKDHSTRIMIASTAGLNEDRIINHIFERKSPSDIKISSLYSVNLHIQSISADGYRYWENMDQLSSYGGSLFSPNPSEVRGNIRCVSDTTELVLGYINAATESSCRKYIDNLETMFYVRPYPFVPDEEYKEDEWYNRYMSGDIPVVPVLDMFGNITGYTWCEKRCVDCRFFGGSKEKPDYWPTGNN